MRTIKISAAQFSLKPVKSFSEFEEMVITAEVDLDELHINREKGAAMTFKDRTRRAELYKELYGR